MVLLYLGLSICSIGIALKTQSSPASHLRDQVFSWWRIFPVISISLLFYPYAPLLLILVICCLAFRELISHHNGQKKYFLFAYVGGFTLIISSSYFSSDNVFLQIPILLLVHFLFFWFRRTANQLLLLMFLVNCYGVSFLIRLQQLHFDERVNLTWLFYLLTMTALNDVAQFVIGKSFGKQKIASRISPNKTWQGLAGGVMVSLIVSALLGSYLHLATVEYLLVVGLLLSIGGFAGDLMFSAAKRFLGIKDFSQLIPGHGGILDRVDSLVVTAPLLYFVNHISYTGS